MAIMLWRTQSRHEYVYPLQFMKLLARLSFKMLKWDGVPLYHLTILEPVILLNNH